jgi:multidrug resistance protein
MPKTKQIFQAAAPTIIGGWSDRIGRRPAYLFSFIVFTAVNIGLALQRSYAALAVLRCMQSIGSSGTVALSSAVVSDVATRQQRGSYIGLAALGGSMGPALGPVIGGLLTHFLGWPSIFWFLSIYSGAMLLVYIIFIPESCRNIVGDGTLEPQPWNKPLVQYIWPPKYEAESASRRTNKRRPGIFSSVPVILDKECFLLLLCGGIIYAGYYMIITGLPQQLQSSYNFNSIQVGLCYLPIGIPMLIMRPIIGKIMDFNFRRHARKTGIEVVHNRQTETEDLPIERARLEISLGLMYLSAAAILPYGWVMGLPSPSLAAVLVLLTITGLCISATFQPVTALVIDIQPERPAAATAAFNFVRCILGAGGVAIVTPLLNSIGRGWTSTLIATVWVMFSGCWWAVLVWGPRWRKEKAAKSSQSSE